MSANDEYDDLDDLLGDAGVQDEILSKPPGSAKDARGNETAGATNAEKKTSAGAESKPEPAVADISTLNLSDSGAQEDAFAQQFKGDVDALLKETDGDPETQKLIEALIGSIKQTSSADTSTEASQSRASGSDAAPKSFQDTISATMDRLNESQRQGPEDQGGSDFMERMLRELQNSAAAGEGGGLDDLLSSMLSELSSKEVLYEPMKDMHTKFPEWMATKGKEVSAEDLQRFKRQQALVAEVVAAYEAPGYSDDNTETRQFITAKMEEMQSTGAPPEELVGDVAGGSLLGGGFPSLDGEGMPPIPGDCATQ